MLADPFGTGDITVQLEADRWKVRSGIDDTNDANELEDLLVDFGGPQGGETATLTLTLPEGVFLIELVQHESSRNSAETAMLSIEDANGLLTGIELTSSFGTDPDAIAITGYTVTSNGIDDVVFTIDNTDLLTTGAYPINGLTITQVVPEPSTLVLLAVGGMTLLRRRRLF